MKKDNFTFLEEDLESMINSFNLWKIFSQLSPLELIANLFFNDVCQNPDKYGITDWDKIGKEWGFSTFIFIISGKIVTVRLAIFTPKEKREFVFGKNLIRFYGELEVTESFYHKFRLFIYSEVVKKELNSKIGISDSRTKINNIVETGVVQEYFPSDR